MGMVDHYQDEWDQRNSLYMKGVTPGIRYTVPIDDEAYRELVALRHAEYQKNGEYNYLLDKYKHYAAAIIKSHKGYVMPPEWRTDTVLALGKQIFENMEFELMPILSDALQDAGCNIDEIHERLQKGPWSRADWILLSLNGRSYPMPEIMTDTSMEPKNADM
jgi:hypothetical protein